MPHIGIDLGTTNSLISVFENGQPVLIKNALGSYLTPSVVHLSGDTLVCGEAAKARLVTSPETTVSVFKRTMGAQKTFNLGEMSLTSEDLSAVVLRSLKQDAEAYLGTEVRDVVISVPAYFNEIQRKAVKAASQTAGLNPLRLINEPTAAALSYGLQDVNDGSLFLVYDLGGGTFDVSILEVFDGVMEVKATAGDAFLGGEDFTDALTTHLAKKIGKGSTTSRDGNALRHVADKLKHELSSRQEATMQAQIAGSDVTISVSRHEFEELTSDLQRRLRKPVERALYDAKLTTGDIERVILVGGATRMPVIRSLVAKMFKQLPASELNPDHVVALGAAVQAGLIGKDKALEDVVMTDVTAFTLGIETSRKIGDSYRPGFYLPIIERNTVVPVSREETIATLEKGQTHIVIRVYQGEAPRVESNIFLGMVEVPVPRNLKEQEAVSVRFTYDISGLLEVDSTVLSTDSTQRIVIDKLAGSLSEQEIKEKLQKLQQLKIHPRDLQENVALQARLEQSYAMARLGDRNYLQSLIVEFCTVIDGQNLSEIAIARQRISATLDAFEANYVR